MTRTIVEAANEIIDDEFMEKIDGGYLVIKEQNNNSNGANCRQVKISMSGKHFCFSLDKKRRKKDGFRVFPFFNPSKEGISKANDMIVFYETIDKLVVLLIELKSKNLGDADKQLKSAKNFVDYFLNTIRLHYGLFRMPEYRGVVFKTGRIATRKGTTKKGFIYDKKDSMLYIELACNEDYKLAQFVESIA